MGCLPGDLVIFTLTVPLFVLFFVYRNRSREKEFVAYAVFHFMSRAVNAGVVLVVFLCAAYRRRPLIVDASPRSTPFTFVPRLVWWVCRPLLQEDKKHKCYAPL